MKRSSASIKFIIVTTLLLLWVVSVVEGDKIRGAKSTINRKEHSSFEEHKEKRPRRLQQLPKVALGKDGRGGGAGQALAKLVKREPLQETTPPTSSPAPTISSAPTDSPSSSPSTPHNIHVEPSSSPSQSSSPSNIPSETTQPTIEASVSPSPPPLGGFQGTVAGKVCPTEVSEFYQSQAFDGGPGVAEVRPCFTNSDCDGYNPIDGPGCCRHPFCICSNGIPDPNNIIGCI
mmetsp:Transcript_10301/g.14778  ORF Transcript_10301/g.14778 Transcript_10301/m.14778 type:complete len:232 (+) Transcript_10301:140-835(+)|eukprot:CAMPEP_0202444942 /NCGR_PEP_ID=MMETSP1360-20130828/3853_1 /ASSEMBLY_ACC=CAM_ASM_000848 /TAXON_ID=515479 /ORGANISM="Licmophora paradoxa, Strain CCMP2313" /LENGTH=231 /DNA_ID=CAMNT_0049061045 /DNA_START=100 /DNA_END=795 /DNA_ORIENTATION=-